MNARSNPSLLELRTAVPIPPDEVKNVDARPAWGLDSCTLQEPGHFEFNRALARINNRAGVKLRIY